MTPIVIVNRRGIPEVVEELERITLALHVGRDGPALHDLGTRCVELATDLHRLGYLAEDPETYGA